jgi:DNA polymerase III subunit delta'
MLFKEIVGHGALKQSMIKSINDGRVSHAQMFLGAEGSGALPLALAYIQYLFCTNKGETDSCGKCSQCHRIAKLTHPDVHFVYPVALSKEKGVEKSSDLFREWTEVFLADPYLSLADWMDFVGAENKQPTIAVEESKDILHKMSLMAMEGNYKTMIIWMPEKMNLSTANKLLKMLEEPPDKTLFILASESSQMLPTILSRTQLTKVLRCEEGELVDVLVRVHLLSLDAATGIAKACEGNYRLAQLMVKGEVDAEFNMQRFQTWMRLCLNLDGLKLSEWINEVASIGREKQKQFIAFAIKTIRQSIMLGLSFPSGINPADEDFLNKFSPFINYENGSQIAEELNNAFYAIERNAHTKILFMSVSLKIHNYFPQRKKSA